MIAVIARVVREAIFARDGHACVYCGVTQDELQTGYMPGPAIMYRLAIDHLIPRAHGGTDIEWNLATACHHCNTSRQTEPWPRSLEMLTDNLAGLRTA